MKILITGGAGFIGSNIAGRLSKKRGYDVVVLDNLFLGSKRNLEGLDVEFVQGSVMDYGKLSRLTRGVDYIFHEAAWSSSPMFLKDPKTGVDINVMGFMNLMNAAIKNNVAKVIFASTSSMYSGNPVPYSEGQEIKTNTFYEASFRAREVIAQTYHRVFGLESIGLRYFSVYGPHERAKGKYANNISQFIWEMIANKSPVLYGDGSQVRDFTHVNDIVTANLLAMKSEIPFDIFNVGTGVGTSFNELINMINKALGTDIKPTYVGNPISNYVQRTIADISKIRREVGFEPTKSIDDGVRETAEYYKDRRHP